MRTHLEEIRKKASTLDSLLASKGFEVGTVVRRLAADIIGLAVVAVGEKSDRDTAGGARKDTRDDQPAEGGDKDRGASETEAPILAGEPAGLEHLRGTQ